MQLSSLYSRLVAHFHPLKAQIQLELLRALPQSSKGAKNLRKWLAWGFLVEEEVALGVASVRVVLTVPRHRRC